MNLANKLTLSRVVMTVVFIGVLLSPLPFAGTTALLVFIAAALTDYYDGRVARLRDERTVFGELLDPLADKVLVLSAFVCFVAIRFEGPATSGRLVLEGSSRWESWLAASLGGSLVPAWAVIIIIARELAVTGLRVLAASRGQSIAAGIGGKQKTVAQLVAVIVILTGEALDHDWSVYLFAEKSKALDYLPVIYFGVTLVALTFTVTSGVYYFWQHRHLLESNK